MGSMVKERRTLLRALSFGALVLGLLGVGASYVIASYQGLDYKCIVDGPFHSEAVVSEAPDIVSGRFSWWPLGRTCAWDRESGPGTVLAHSGSYAASAVTYMLIAGGTLGAIASVAGRRSRS